jgi:hypothetical protein
MSDLTTRVARTVGKHFVTLSCIQRPLGDLQPKTLVFSGFLVEILDEWFYVTAGHILRDISTAMAAGSKFDVWRFDDQTAGNRFSGKAVPYAFDLSAWLVLQDDSSGFDYATVHIAPFYRRQLEAGGATPIRKTTWSDHVAAADYWVLVGIPSESVSYDGDSVIRARVVVAPLRPAETPDLAVGKAENQFYASLLDGSEAFFKDADGFSGGPVFALKKVNGSWRYGVIGVQSAWYRSSRTMAICPFTSFGLALEPVVVEAITGNQHVSGTSAAE